MTSGNYSQSHTIQNSSTMCNKYLSLVAFYNVLSILVSWFRNQSSMNSFFLCIGFDLQPMRFCFPQAPSTGKDDKILAESSPDQDMTTSSQHYFGSIEDGFSINIIEVLILAPLRYPEVEKRHNMKEKRNKCETPVHLSLFVFQCFLIFICLFPIRIWKKNMDYLYGHRV